MTAQDVVDLLLEHDGGPDFEACLDRCRPHFTIDVIIALKQRVDSEKLRHANRALQIAGVAVRVAGLMDLPEAAARAAWARGNALHYLRQGQEALACYRSAEAFFAAHAFPLEKTILQVNQVGTLLEMGHLHEAIALADRARAACVELGAAARPFLALLEMNAGVAFRQLGDLDATLAAYARGRALFAALGDVVQTARIDINRAHALQEMDRFADAETLLHSARAALAQTGQTQEVARADLNLGLLAYRQGHYQAALHHLETAHQGFEAIGNQADVAFADLTRSSIYRRLNLVQETITLATSAERTFRRHSMPAYEVLALMNQAAGCRHLNEWAQADRLLTRARRIARRQGAGRRVLELDLERAAVAFEEGRPERAGRLARRVARTVDAQTWPSLAARVHLLRARSALALNPTDLTAARAATFQALDLTARFGLREETWQAHGLRAQLLELEGDTTQALQTYLQAVAALELWRGMLHVDEFQTGFMNDKLPVYLAAARLCRQHGSPATLLHLLNLAHTAPLVHRDLSLEIVGEPDSEVSDIEQRARALRATWHWEHSKLDQLLAPPAHAAPDPQPEHQLATTHQKILDIEAELAELQRRLHAHTAPLTTHTPISAGDGLPTAATAGTFLAAVQRRLGVHEALLTYFIVADTLHVLLITRNAVHDVANLVTAETLHRMRQVWHFHLAYVAARGVTSDDQVLAEAYLARFFQMLVLPLQPHLAAATHLYLVLPPGWHDLPFAAFFDGQHYLIERFQLTYLSAPEALLTAAAAQDPLTEAPALDGRRPSALVVGYSDGGRLPAAVAEARAVASLLTGVLEPVLLVEADATLDAVARATRDARLVHMASHATFRPENPMFSWMLLADTRLAVTDLYTMTLPRRPLVVLSACETGRGQARGGGLLGMGRGFLAAGASGLVVSLWKAADTATAELMVDFYRGFLEPGGPDAAASLQRAQLCMLQRHHHAFFWAGFVYIRG